MHYRLSDSYTCYFLWIISIAGIITACRPGESDKTDAVGQSQAIPFEHTVQADYAEGFRITYHKNYKLLEVFNPFQDRVDTLRYALVPRSVSDQVKVANARTIEIPIRSLIATSTTHLALATALESNDIIKGMVGGKYVYNDEIRNRLETGKITNFSEGEFNKEQALALDPDLVMISGGQSSQFDNYRVLIKSGIDILVNSEWLETTPLGKAEWVKVMGALLDKEAMANEHFESVEQRYNTLKSKVTDIDKNPVVLTNLPFKGSWFVPGGNSYNAKILNDAGADYPWSDSEETGGLQKDFEVMYEIGLTANIWLNPGEADSKTDILAKDTRFKEFRSFRMGEIYNNNKRVGSTGGNDFWESGVVHPEIILADLIKIFHPQRVPDHTLYYYQKVE